MSYRRKRRSSTNIVKMRFQSFMDISTNANSMQVITISAGGPEILRRLSCQFGAYKYFRIGKISAKLVPASTLPVDPTGLSITAGDNLVDPRDQLTPGMMRITNGEDIFEDLTGLTDAQQHAIYNNMLLDPRWFKWMLQSGTKRSAFPRYWQIGQLHQDKWPGAVVNIPNMQTDAQGVVSVRGTDNIEKSFMQGGSATTEAFDGGSSPYGLFQTGHKGVLGWLPTDCLQPIRYAFGQAIEAPMLASPPEIECFKILLPKAYKTRYWYRLFITEEVWFREPIVNFGIADPNNQYYRPLDIFHVPVMNSPVTPDTPISYGSVYPPDNQTGGNYGND